MNNDNFQKSLIFTSQMLALHQKCGKQFDGSIRPSLTASYNAVYDSGMGMSFFMHFIYVAQKTAASKMGRI